MLNLKKKKNQADIWLETIQIFRFLCVSTGNNLIQEMSQTSQFQEFSQCCRLQPADSAAGMDGSKDNKTADVLFVQQTRPSVPEKSLSGEDWVVCPRRLSSFTVKTSRARLRQTESLIAKGLVVKAAGGLILRKRSNWRLW